MAILALLGFAGSVAWDATDPTLWARHALLASVAASLIVVMLSIAVINETIERRRGQRWSVLAQYVLFESLTWA